jgi:hypothetical protein
MSNATFTDPKGIAPHLKNSRATVRQQHRPMVCSAVFDGYVTQKPQTLSSDSFAYDDGHKLINRDVNCNCHLQPPQRSCMFCDGGLTQCEICGGGEGALPTHCPGRPMTSQETIDFSKHIVDFIDGNWKVTKNV